MWSVDDTEELHSHTVEIANDNSEQNWQQDPRFYHCESLQEDILEEYVIHHIRESESTCEEVALDSDGEDTEGDGTSTTNTGSHNDSTPSNADQEEEATEEQHHHPPETGKDAQKESIEEPDILHPIKSESQVRPSSVVQAKNEDKKDQDDPSALIEVEIDHRESSGDSLNASDHRDGSSSLLVVTGHEVESSLEVVSKREVESAPAGAQFDDHETEISRVDALVDSDEGESSLVEAQIDKYEVELSHEEAHLEDRRVAHGTDHDSKCDASSAASSIMSETSSFITVDSRLDKLIRSWDDESSHSDRVSWWHARREMLIGCAETYGVPGNCTGCFSCGADTDVSD